MYMYTYSIYIYMNTHTYLYTSIHTSGGSIAVAARGVNAAGVCRVSEYENINIILEV